MDAYQLVFLRHGQSIWNLENRFTGWTDVVLTDHGRQEASEAGKRLAAAGFRFDLAFSSCLRRSWETLDLVIARLPAAPTQVVRTWELNERHYGSLQGLNKAETAHRLGNDRVMHWRRSLTGRPPALELDDSRHPRFDRRYSRLPDHRLPRTESLKDTADRILPYWRSQVIPRLRSGRQILVVAHGNSLRALVQHLEAIPESEVPAIHIPTGVPIVYRIDRSLQPLQRYEIQGS